jgi:hypothetical protein
MTDNTMSPDELRRLAALSLQKWGAELSRRLSQDESWRLLLGAAIAVMQASHTNKEMAAVFREAAALIERGELKRGKQH